MAPLPTLGLPDLVIDDEASFSHIGLYADLKAALERADPRFLVLDGRAKRPSWERALFLNLTFWHAAEPLDVLVENHIPADVVAHIAWHRLAATHLGEGGRLSVPALLLSESIASAFDLYLVGRLLGHRPDAEMLETQIPQMAECALSAGMSETEFEALLQSVSEAPERAFEDLRALLFDASTGLFDCADVGSAMVLLESLEDRRFASLLHHYELSNWVLYARAHGGNSAEDPRSTMLDASLRKEPDALKWLEQHWVHATLAVRTTHVAQPRRTRPR